MRRNINLLKPKYYQYDADGTMIDVAPCSFKVLKLIDFSEAAIKSTLFDILNDNAQGLYINTADLSYEKCVTIATDYIGWLNSVKEADPQLQVPHAKYYKSDDDIKIDFSLNFDNAKIIADFARISIFEVYELNYFDYCALMHDAVIDLYARTDKGKKYLHNCWIEQQTDIDSDGLSKLFGTNGRLGGNNNG